MGGPVERRRELIETKLRKFLLAPFEKKVKYT